MHERIRFVRDCRSGLYEMTEQCERYGISRKTGCKWLQGCYPAWGPRKLLAWLAARTPERPVAGNRSAQQRRFNRFREVYNHERPHEALG